MFVKFNILENRRIATRKVQVHKSSELFMVDGMSPPVQRNCLNIFRDWNDKQPTHRDTERSLN